jgi:ABC-type dipeptide/oligopeptide/nickel transport system permease component
VNAVARLVTLTVAARLVGALVFLLAASVAAFTVVRAMPGDAAETVLVAQGVVPSPEQVAALRAAHGLDAPVWRQFVLWLARLAEGDLGTSLRSGEPVLQGLLARLPVSLTIGLGGLMIGTALAYILGLAAAGGVRGAESASRTLALLAQAVPAFCLAVVVIWIFGVEFRWIRPFTGGVVERVILPLAIVALYAAGGLVRVASHAAATAAAAPWFRAVLAKGLSPRRALRRHTGPFEILALLAALRAEAAWVIGGTAVLEVVFASPGVSAWVVESIAQRDYPVLQAYILTVAVWMMLVRLVVDQLSSWLDPRREAA